MRSVAVAITVIVALVRELVQFGSTLALGARSRRFKSCILDHVDDYPNGLREQS